MVTFLKKNILFFSVFVVAFAISLFLLVLDISLFAEIQEGQQKIKETTEKYNKERDSKVMPVKQNADKIQEDTAELKLQVLELQRKFGLQYRKFLLQFARETGIDESTLISEFKKHFDEYKVKNADREESLAELLNRPPNHLKDQVFFAFMDKYRERLALILSRRAAEMEAKKKTQEYNEENVKVRDADKAKIQNAFARFFTAMISEPLFTVENLTPGDERARRRVQEDIFASALGLPRTKSALDCFDYLLDMQREFVAKRLIPGVTDLETVRSFTYDKYVTDNPRSSEIPEILLAMPVFEDVARRLRSVRDIEVTEMSKSGPSPAPASDKYIRYTFKLKVNCTMSSIREFVNKLHEAYKDNRVYVVRWISVSAGSENELAELKKILEDQSGNTGNVRLGQRGNMRFDRNAAGATGIAPYLESLDPKYATAIVGKGTGVTAEIDFDYYIYIGERVYTYQVNQQ